MVKVEAVVIRERVETVIDAVEEATGHVGVTVIEAIGHGRQRGVTHEYRGRVFESRFLPKALVVFVVEDGLERWPPKIVVWCEPLTTERPATSSGSVMAATAMTQASRPVATASFQCRPVARSRR